MATTLRCSLALAVAVASLISAGCDLPTELQPKVSRSPRPDPAAGADLQNATSTEPLPAVSSVQQYPDPRFQSPEAVFAAAQTAAATGQWSEYCQCLSESGLRRLARTLLFSAIMESHLSQIPGLDDGQSNATAIVLRKYGVPSEYTTDPQKLNDRLNRIGNLKEFIIEMLTVKQQTDATALPVISTAANLTALSTTGMNARGTIVDQRSGNPESEAILFEQVDGMWRFNYVYIPSQ